MLTVSALPPIHHHGCSHYTSKSLVCSPSRYKWPSSSLPVPVPGGAGRGRAQVFVADQFDQHDHKESVSRSSVFNWWYFGMCSGRAMIWATCIIYAVIFSQSSTFISVTIIPVYNRAFVPLAQRFTRLSSGRASQCCSGSARASSSLVASPG
jgi:hypothetical protein